VRRTCWLCHRYEASFQLDSRGPTWAPAVLQEVRLPRWSFEGVDKGAVVFVRATQPSPNGATEARLRLTPSSPRPEVTLEVCARGKWDVDDEDDPPPAAYADILEEAEALLVLLGCRSPQLRCKGAQRLR
jgi:hypothetical protein